jgi:hypothetical protein
MPPSQAKHLTTSSSTRGQPVEGSSEGSCTTDCCTNYTTVEEIPTREVVLAGTFFLDERPIIILFDSGSSNDFMSFTCAKKAKLSLVALGAPYMISTPGGRVDADQVVQKVLLELSRRIFSTNLIIEWSRYSCCPRDELDEAT